MLNRRRFLQGVSAGLLAAPLGAEAQPAEKIARIGYLAANVAAGDPRQRAAFLRGLRDLGYVEGRNLLIEHRDAGGKTERFSALAAELAALKVDLILASGGTLAALAAQHATTTRREVRRISTGPSRK
jgi:putative ABC transport system substrate-binding protein